MPYALGMCAIAMRHQVIFMEIASASLIYIAHKAAAFVRATPRFGYVVGIRLCFTRKIERNTNVYRLSYSRKMMLIEREV